MDPDQERLLKETYRLSVENNRMLRKMRRGAIWSRIITILIYAAAIGVPIWFYMTYISDTVDHLLQAYGIMQARGEEVQGQYQGFMEAFREFQGRFSGGSATSSQGLESF